MNNPTNREQYCGMGVVGFCLFVLFCFMISCMRRKQIKGKIIKGQVDF